MSYLKLCKSIPDNVKNCSEDSRAGISVVWCDFKIDI